MKLLDTIQKILNEQTSDRMLKVFDIYMKQNFPNFRKNKSKIFKKGYGQYTITDPTEYEEALTPTGFSIDYRIYARYFAYNKELYVARDVFDPVIEMFDKNGVQYLIDWFNKEFGFDAEFITI